MSQPKIWKLKDGSTTELDSPYNIRAKELKDIYNSLNMSYLTQDERLDVLLTLKHTVKVDDVFLNAFRLNINNLFWIKNVFLGTRLQAYSRNN